MNGVFRSSESRVEVYSANRARLPERGREKSWPSADKSPKRKERQRRDGKQEQASFGNSRGTRARASAGLERFGLVWLVPSLLPASMSTSNICSSAPEYRPYFFHGKPDLSVEAAGVRLKDNDGSLIMTMASSSTLWAVGQFAICSAGPSTAFLRKKYINTEERASFPPISSEHLHPDPLSALDSPSSAVER